MNTNHLNHFDEGRMVHYKPINPLGTWGSQHISDLDHAKKQLRLLQINNWNETTANQTISQHNSEVDDKHKFCIKTLQALCVSCMGRFKRLGNFGEFVFTEHVYDFMALTATVSRVMVNTRAKPKLWQNTNHHVPLIVL